MVILKEVVKIFRLCLKITVTTSLITACSSLDWSGARQLLPSINLNNSALVNIQTTAILSTAPKSFILLFYALPVILLAAKKKCQSAIVYVF